jgi:exodeoxyribonuclease VII large subunit
MFRRAAMLLDFAPSDGQQVELRGRMAVYEPRGELQFVVEAMRPAGAGALYERFLQLQRRLQAEGLFDPARKRALLAYPRSVGVVTSLGAAALRDVATTLARRAPHVRVVVYPSLVQGTEAPAALAEAIATAARRGEVDTLIVCRGGGSMEDLWAFNDERVVRAIAASPIPVISGVGHETDVTLADFVADVRAPTPTAAAELVAPATLDCLNVLAARQHALSRRLRRSLDAQAQRLDHTAVRLARPADVVGRQAQRLDHLAHRLASAARRRVAPCGTQLDQLEARLRRAAAVATASKAQRLTAIAARLQALDPKQVLLRGYAWLADEAGQPVLSIRQLRPQQAVQAVLGDGIAQVRVERVDPAPG